eukprot:CAMPEP_0196574192 /NCGR_PEP_ID=MMETSP1081-20130531/3956_1 /TAXON_ID=36882 /ORGANISM="Pyramimonas amylifera, Strain CCMP720" /LENGTH=212 /DNA_ID=CAMNT_0041892139 /DNA_START=380 /DNA_END=1018 /DNA_ORIENTATION=+
MFKHSCWPQFLYLVIALAFVTLVKACSPGLDWQPATFHAQFRAATLCFSGTQDSILTCEEFGALVGNQNNCYSGGNVAKYTNVSIIKNSNSTLVIGNITEVYVKTFTSGSMCGIDPSGQDFVFGCGLDVGHNESLAKNIYMMDMNTLGSIHVGASTISNFETEGVAPLLEAGDCVGESDMCRDISTCEESAGILLVCIPSFVFVFIFITAML